jgi:hypothetical protein
MQAVVVVVLDPVELEELVVLAAAEMAEVDLEIMEQTVLQVLDQAVVVVALLED